MAQITLTFVGRTVGVYGLERERLTIGRRPDNDIHIENLAVSGYHAVVLRTDEGHVIEDLNSTNGTYLGDAPVKRHLLRPGDILRVGKHELVYSTEEKTAAEAPKAAAPSPAPSTATDTSFSIAAGDTTAPGAVVRLPPCCDSGTEWFAAWHRVDAGTPAHPFGTSGQAECGHHP